MTVLKFEANHSKHDSTPHLFAMRNKKRRLLLPYPNEAGKKNRIFLWFNALFLMVLFISS